MKYTEQELNQAFKTIRSQTDLDDDLVDFIENAGLQLLSIHDSREKMLKKKEKQHEFIMDSSNTRWIWVCEKKLFSYYRTYISGYRVSEKTYSLQQAYDIEMDYQEKP